jgi:photosystem II stability/assembly factor-like uncharacterized protein
VGTGEGNVHVSSLSGDGVYRSLDGGKTWSHLGLEGTERISRIVLHPTDPGVAWVAALGPSYRESPERGVFKTEDGGRTWTKVLAVDAKTGAADLAIDPRNPDRLYAAMWEHRRWPWFFRSGGPGSGLYVSDDGGRTWTRRTAADGLPAGELGRIKLAVSRSRPEVVYAMVEARTSALLRSEDGGASFRTVNDGPNLDLRPFYFAALAVDPKEPDRLYNLDLSPHVSEDGGRTFRDLLPGQRIHPDLHAIWIDPGDPRRLAIGTDGGVFLSRDRGRTAAFVPNLPLGQFYRVAVDQEIPYNVYGGLQDNGSWRGPSDAWEAGGIQEHSWTFVGVDDGSAAFPDPADPDLGYTTAQNGALQRWNLRTGEIKDIAPPPLPSGPGARLRFSFTGGMALDPFAPGTLYAGSQFVHRSTDRGESWRVISPDLTTNNPEWQRQAGSGGLTPDAGGAESFTTITAIAPSTLKRGLLWAGTDDGRVHVTRDGGGHWTSIEAHLLKIHAPDHARVAMIRPSRFDPASAFVVLDDHRRGDSTPWVFRTDDFGATWRSLATPDLQGHALALEQDPVDQDLLFLGTARGLWISLDGGRRWMPWRHGLPAVPVTDLVVHPRDHDLVIATFGRGLYILDDIRPLREIGPAVLAEPLHLFAVPDARQHWNRAGTAGHGGNLFHGEGRDYGALLTVSSAQGGPAEIRVEDASGATVRTFHEALDPGINRLAWGLERDTFKLSPRGKGQPPRPPDPPGPEVPPGLYTVVVKLGGSEVRRPVRVLPDPRSRNTPADWQARWKAVLRAGHLQDLGITAVERLRKTREEVGADAGLQNRITAMEGRLRLLPDMPLGSSRDELVIEKVWAAVDSLQTSMSPPSPSQLALLDRAEKVLKAYLADLDRFYKEEVEPFLALTRTGSPPAAPPSKPAARAPSSPAGPRRRAAPAPRPGWRDRSGSPRRAGRASGASPPGRRPGRWRCPAG